MHQILWEDRKGKYVSYFVAVGKKKPMTNSNLWKRQFALVTAAGKGWDEVGGWSGGWGVG